MFGDCSFKITIKVQWSGPGNVYRYLCVLYCNNADFFLSCFSPCTYIQIFVTNILAKKVSGTENLMSLNDLLCAELLMQKVLQRVDERLTVKCMNAERFLGDRKERERKKENLWTGKSPLCCYYSTTSPLSHNQTGRKQSNKGSVAFNAVQSIFNFLSNIWIITVVCSTMTDLGRQTNPWPSVQWLLVYTNSLLLHLRLKSAMRKSEKSPPRQLIVINRFINVLWNLKNISELSQLKSTEPIPGLVLFTSVQIKESFTI